MPTVRSIIKKKARVIRIIMEDIAAGVGSGTYSICDINSTGRVRVSFATRNAEIVTSLNENVKAIMAPAIMPGKIMGKVTFQNVAHGVAPRL